MQLRETRASAYREVDFDLHGLVGIRLVNASEAEARVVDRQVGPIRRSITREPDIVVEFVDRLGDEDVRLVGLDDVAYSKHSFLLQPRGPDRPHARLHLDGIGKQCRIVCERGVAPVPLLIAIVNLTMLSKGIVPVHASAFTYRGKGVLVTGWAKGGKTEVLLSFMQRGAEYVGDEWVYLDPGTRRMYGIPEPIRLWDWHFPDLPEYLDTIGRRGRTRLQVMRAARDVGRRLSPGSGPIARVADRITPVIQRQMFVHVPPASLFGPLACSLEGKLEKLVFVLSHSSPEVTVEPIDSGEVIRRMLFSLRYERLPLYSTYLKYRFAFPDTAIPAIEEADERERKLLRALSGIPAYALYHPFPAPIGRLFSALEPVL
ncbi:MAG TPA: hypothetical protein VFE20_07830 [Thermoleophilia bacterium]|nr:hypothetical protein [Thermoleophilia bacterium]